MLKELYISTNAAIDIAGIPSKSEYFAASSLFQPSKRALEIVIPDLDTPGIIAKDCAKPIKKLFIKLWFKSDIFLLLLISDKYINKPVKIEINPINKFERKVDS